MIDAVVEQNSLQGAFFVPKSSQNKAVWKCKNIPLDFADEKLYNIYIL